MAVNISGADEGTIYVESREGVGFNKKGRECIRHNIITKNTTLDYILKAFQCIMS